MTPEQYNAFCDWVELINLPEESWDMYFEAYFQALKEM